MVAIQFYRKFITEFVREQMIVLGPNLAVDTANRAEGITINNRGQVVEIVGEGSQVLFLVVQEYLKLSPQLTNYSIHSLFVKYPDIAEEYPEHFTKVSLICPLMIPEA